MDGLALTLFLFAAFIGGIVSGLAGFAFGLVVSGIWLHVVTPVQFAILIVLSGLVTQGYGIWKVRKSLDWRKVAPFVIGGAVGVPAGTALLAYTDPTILRIAIGALLIVYSLYNLARPAIAPVRAGLPADLGIGVANGMLGGLTGLGGIIVTVWCQLRGGPKDAQRAIFQPVLLATFIMTAISLSVAGAVTTETVTLFLFSVPALIAGLWVGVRLYGRLDDAVFRKTVLVLLLVSGAILVLPY